MAFHPNGCLPGRHCIESYGEGGFFFGDMSHRGSILALPSGVYIWEPETPEDMTEASFARLFAEPVGAVAHLLLGVGAIFAPLPPALRARFKQAGIVAEPMSTGAAARTYNILLGENRPVAAALLAVNKFK